MNKSFNLITSSIISTLNHLKIEGSYISILIYFLKFIYYLRTLNRSIAILLIPDLRLNSPLHHALFFINLLDYIWAVPQNLPSFYPVVRLHATGQRFWSFKIFKV